MEDLEGFRDQFKPFSEAESMWLTQIFRFIRDQVCPVLPAPASPATGGPSRQRVYHLSTSAVKIIREKMAATCPLPVSYRLLSISELLAHQNLACVSNLSWSTSQQRALAREVELQLPGCCVLPRVNLLLIGCLKQSDGEWRLTDASGSVRCEILSPSRLLDDSPVFLPHWNYIPCSSPGQKEIRGYLELMDAPVQLHPGPEHGSVAGPSGVETPGRAFSVSEGAIFVRKRVKGQRISVCGQVSSVCPLLVVAGTTFFCFSLKDSTHTLPVLVKEPSRLWWAGRVHVGQTVCVTALRVCVLRGWKGNNVLCVTERSQIHDWHTHTHLSADDTPSDAPPPAAATSRGGDEDDRDALDDAGPDELRPHPTTRGKRSRVISYRGTVTAVVSEGAGLYLIDKEVGLCLAHQPTLKRPLRPGDAVELDHVHFLYRPCPDFPPGVLCTCLRSSLRVTAFSGAAGSRRDAGCPGDGVLPRLLLEKNVGVSDYLWVCKLSSQLYRSLTPGDPTPTCVCVLAWKVMETVLKSRKLGRRDIYGEMLEEPHLCPLTQYTSDRAVPQHVSVSELLASLEDVCWSSLSLRSLLPSSGSGLTSAQINSALAWSCARTAADLRRRPLLVVGVLELPSQTSGHALQLRDNSGAVACVVTETGQDQGGGQGAAFNTAWIGCLVCVQKFTMVTERDIQSDFPSDQHLDQDKFITHKRSRIYLQFSLDCIHILSPSVAMEIHLGALRAGGGEGQEEEEKKKKKEDEEGPSAGKKMQKVSLHAGIATNPRASVAMVIRVVQKEGLAWVNSGVEVSEDRTGLTPCFQVRVAPTGPAVRWDRDPKNEPPADAETLEPRGTVILTCSGVCARWFPLLQPGRFYRLVVANTQDPSVLVGCRVPGWKGVQLLADSTLQVQPGWRFHTLTHTPLLQKVQQSVPLPVLSVSQVLESSSAELVCFQGLVCDRISLVDRTKDLRHTHTGVRLGVCDQSGRSIYVYLNLSRTPYPPGLLPGNTLLLSSFQRKVSRSGSVYCSYLPVSWISVVALGDRSSAEPPAAPPMRLGPWASGREHASMVGRVKGHLVRVLFLQLQWSCSLCGSVYKQSACSLHCRSPAAVFQSKAKFIMEDGTGEAHVWLSGPPVRLLLGLDDSQWEGLQRAIRVRGHVSVYPRGRSQVCDADSDDDLLHFLLCLCSSGVVCQTLSLTCRKNINHKPEEMKRFTQGEQDFVTRMSPALVLTCLQLH